MSRKKSVYAQRFHYCRMIGATCLVFHDELDPRARVELQWSAGRREFYSRVFSTKDYIIRELDVSVDVLRKRIPRHVMARLIAAAMTRGPEESSWERAAAGAAMSNILLAAVRKSVSDLFRVPLEPTQGGVFKMQTRSRLTGDELKSALKPKKKE